jgi:hypothetical protein
MNWSHWACAMAGSFVGSFLMTVWNNERSHRRNRDLFHLMYHLGEWRRPDDL